jgi:hypothetical protein
MVTSDVVGAVSGGIIAVGFVGLVAMVGTCEFIAVVVAVVAGAIGGHQLGESIGSIVAEALPCKGIGTVLMAQTGEATSGIVIHFLRSKVPKPGETATIEVKFAAHLKRCMFLIRMFWWLP